MRRIVIRLAGLMVPVLTACSGGDGPAAPELAPLAMTPATVDAEAVAMRSIFSDETLRALIPLSSARVEAALRTGDAHHPAILDPVTRTVLPAASRGRVFTADGTGRWTGTPSAAVPANGAVITVYPTMPFGGGTPVGTLTVLDSTVGGLGVAVLTLRNAAGAIVLQGRVTQEAATGRIVTTAAIGGGPSPSARLVDTLEVLANRIAGRITLTATGGEWYLDEDLANESRATAELVARGDTLRAVSVPLPGGLDSTAFRLNGRSLGYFRGDDTLRGAASADATALVAAVVRFAQEVPLPNLLGVAVSSILLIVRDTSVPGLGIAVPLAP